MATTTITDGILVFADGACTGNPGPGGWGAILVTPEGQVTELGGREPATTNNRMELTAAGKALRHLERQPGPVAIYTDSSYVINGITKWIWGWRKRGWKTAEGGDVANAEFWKRLSAILAKRSKDFEGGAGEVRWHYVRGHSGVPGNERADEIAVAFANGKRRTLYRGSLLKYDVPIHDLPEDTSVPERSGRMGEKAAPAYSYVSLVGATAARHSTWKECEARVKGVPGAKFKKCADAEEERMVLEGWGVRLTR